MNPLVSIITPTYNHENYISKCIDSLLEQDYQNWEQIIVDDGSTDSTESIISKYEDERIIYIKQMNKGIFRLSESYNKALQKSKGDLIAILEGDDFWPNYKLSKQISAFEYPEVVLSWGNAQIVNDEGTIEGYMHKPNSFPEISTTYETLDNLLLRNYIPACTVLCRKQALLDIGGFQQPTNSPCIDYSTWLQLSKLGSFFYNDNIMGIWRRHKGQVSSKNAYEMLKSGGDYSIEFFNNMDPWEKKTLHININDIMKIRNKMVADFNFGLGRKYLYENKWNKSRECFKISLNGSNIIKIYSIFGIFCSYLKIDIEWIISILNKNHIKNL